MRVAVTGATGFLGAALCRALVGAGHEVVALLRPNSDQTRIADLTLTKRWADVTDSATLAPAIAGCDWLVHAAGRLGAFGISEEAYHQLHVEGTRNVLVAAQAANVQRVLYVSSPGVLGSTDGAALEESAEYNPTNRYERSKAEAEKVAREFTENGLLVIIVRPEFVYGPGDTHVLDLFKAVQNGRIFLIDGGKSYCHPTYIDDAVSGMMLALDKGEVGEIYHIAGHESLPMRDFLGHIAAAVGGKQPSLSLPSKMLKPVAAVAEKAGETVGIKPPLTPSAVDFFSTSYRFATQKARSELGYRPTTSIQDGLRWSVEWYREQGLLDDRQDAKTPRKKGIREYYPYAMAEGEGVGTAYEYFVKQQVLQKFLKDKQIERVLIAGLPQKYGHSSDFLLLAGRLGAHLTIIDERADKLGATVTLTKDGDLADVEVEFHRIESYAKIDFADGAFDLVLSSEVMQRLDVDEREAFSAELTRVAHHVAIFCPNASNNSHVGRSGLDGLTLEELQGLFPDAVQSGLIDMPPFPPGVALSDEQRESAESGKLQQVAMRGLQLYSYGEKLLPKALRQRFAHIVYVFQ